MVYQKIKNETRLNPCTNNHKKFIKSIKRNQYTICMGMQGTGKTFYALQTAIELFNNNYYDIRKIFYVRPHVKLNSEQELGAVKGNFKEKVFHLALPVFDNLSKIMSLAEIKELFIEEDPKFEISNLQYLRGRSLDNCVVIFDEAQNTNLDGITTVLTRIGESSKLIMVGDPNQCDVGTKHDILIASTRMVDRPSKEELDAIMSECYEHYIKNRDYDDEEFQIIVEEGESVIDNYQNPFQFAFDRLSNLPNFSCIEFTEEDVVRNKNIAAIVNALKL